MPPKQSRVALTLLLVLSATAWIDGQTNTPPKNGTKTGTVTQNPPPNTSAPPEILKVTINSSRISVTRDGSYAHCPYLYRNDFVACGTLPGVHGDCSIYRTEEEEPVVANDVVFEEAEQASFSRKA